MDTATPWPRAKPPQTPMRWLRLRDDGHGAWRVGDALPGTRSRLALPSLTMTFTRPDRRDPPTGGLR